MTTINDTGTLVSLRALAVEAPASITDLFRVAEQQARLLRELVAATADPLLTRLTDLIPTLCIEVLDAMPVTSVSFWGNGCWHIHLRADDSTSNHHFAMLHQLKHIIDHPLRQRLTSFTDTDWEAVANYFAEHTLTLPTKNASTRQERRDAYEPSH
jgi:IrrE N-terminal-like domain